MAFGQGRYRYEVVDGWGALPDGVRFSEVAAVAVDSQDRVYAYHRGSNPVVAFDRGGRYLESWGDGFLKEAHGMCIDADDNLFLVDRGSHSIEKCRPDGTRVATFGPRDNPAPAFSNQPCNLPQGVAVAPSGAVYVADGKNNNAIHKYAADGAYLFSWGRQGDKAGEFNEPHGIWVLANEVVVVPDRGNDRMQFFSPDGTYLTQWGVEVIHHPDHIYFDRDGVFYVTEIDYHRVSVLSPDGELLSRWGGGPGVQEGRLAGAKTPGLFNSPHGIWCDSQGSLYVSEVRDGRRVQKFVRV